MLEIAKLTAGPGAAPVVHDVDLELADGERAALVGPSGAGKSTVLRAVAGLVRATSGHIAIGGVACVDGPRSLVPPDRRGVSLVFQSYALWPHLTAAQHVRLVSRGRPGPDWLDRVGLGALRDRTPGRLSGGEQARLALARAMAAQPRLLLLDEPFRSLDPDLARHLRAQLASWLEEHPCAVLLVTHDLDEAAELTSTVAVLESGRIIACDAPHELRRNPQVATVARLFGEVRFLSGRRTGPESFDTQLGPLEVFGPSDATHAAVRPNSLEATVDATGRAVARGTRRIGFDRLVEVDVDGQRLIARLAADGPVADGTPIGLHVRAPLPLVRVRNDTSSIPQEIPS